jgi:hypothetical protein
MPRLNPDMRMGKCISRASEYTQLIYDQTSSPRLDKVLEEMRPGQLGICGAMTATWLHHPGRFASLPVYFSRAMD